MNFEFSHKRTVTQLKLFIILIIAFSNLTYVAQNIDSMVIAATNKSERIDQAFAFLEISNVCEIKDIEQYANKALKLAEPFYSDKNNKYHKNALSVYADAYNNIGYGKQQMGKTGEALNYYYKAIGLYESKGDEILAFETYNNLAAIYLDQGDSSKCLEIYMKLLTLKKVQNDPKSYYQLNNNIGYYYNETNNFRKALHYYLIAKKQTEILPNEADRCYINNNIGSTYLHLKMYDSALVYIWPSVDYYKSIEDEETLAWTYNLLGRTFMDMAEYDKAENYLNLAKDLSRKLELKKQLMQVLENLVYVSRNKGKYKEALDFLLEKDKIEKQIINNDNLKKIYQKEAELEIQKNEAIANERSERDKLTKLYLIVCLVLASLIALVAIRSFIIKRRSNNLLEKQNLIISEQKKEVEEKKNIIEEKQKEIVDSINYAKRIQYALLAHDEFLKDNLPQHFVYFKPKDIVSGDFYWATSIGSGAVKKFYLAVCDSTGHGVPGAFMSLLNIGFLSEAINEKGITEPNKVFDHVRKRLIDHVSKDGQKDGFDGILACLDFEDTSKIKLTYAAANNAPVLVRGHELVELEKDRMPVGFGELKDPFKAIEMDLMKGDMLFFYTDGFADQFGGPKGKKFKYKQLNELLLANSSQSVNEFRSVIDHTFEKWRGGLEQVDDVCIIGIRI